VSHKDYDEVITVKKEKKPKGDNSNIIKTGASVPVTTV
jgi:hypothetical protein